LVAAGMTQPQAFLNGRFVPASQATVSVTDGGFVQGTTVAEQLRTFNGKLFRLSDHVQRLMQSLKIVQVEPGLSPQQLCEAAQELATHNHAMLAPGDDLGLAVLVTPGPYPAMTPDASSRPTLCMHTFALRFDLWTQTYQTGQSLATTDVAQVSAKCWPSEMKCRSRMHYFLADRQAAARFPGSRALMLDPEGFVTETTTANLVASIGGDGLVTPPSQKVLPGISLAALTNLAKGLEIPLAERDLRPADLLAADEVLLSATSVCTLPVVELNGRPIGSRRPGPMFARLMQAWSELVGLDIVQQAQRFAAR
jgi:branched-chain amino acid aminotransferase